MKIGNRRLVITLVILSSIFFFSQKRVRDNKQESRILSTVQLEKLMAKPECLEGYRTNQSGPLTRIDPIEGEIIDSTFTVEKMQISSDGFLIYGWL